MELLACHDCDLLQHRQLLHPGQAAYCSRCGALLYRYSGNQLDQTLALSLTSLILFILANSFPFISMEVQGLVQTISLPATIWALYQEQEWLLALCVGFMIFLAPLLKLIGLLYVLLPLKWNRSLPRTTLSYRIVALLTPWSMMEVYLIGTLVALVKLAEMADIVLGISFWSFIALIICETAASVALSGVPLWQGLERRTT